jgi:hypothetical protein
MKLRILKVITAAVVVIVLIPIIFFLGRNVVGELLINFGFYQQGYYLSDNNDLSLKIPPNHFKKITIHYNDSEDGPKTSVHNHLDGVEEIRVERLQYGKVIIELVLSDERVLKMRMFHSNNWHFEEVVISGNNHDKGMYSVIHTSNESIVEAKLKIDLSENIAPMYYLGGP